MSEWVREEWKNIYDGPWTEWGMEEHMTIDRWNLSYDYVHDKEGNCIVFAIGKEKTKKELQVVVVWS